MALTAAIYAPIRHAGLVYEDETWHERPGVTWQIPGSALALRTLTVAAPGPEHLAQVGLHLANGVLVAVLGSLVVSPPVGVAAATLFLLHPLNTEAVDYLKARSDVLVTTWLLLGAILAVLPATRVRRAALLLLAMIAAFTDPVGLLLLPLATMTSLLFRPRQPYEPAIAPEAGLLFVGMAMAAFPILVIEGTLPPASGGTGLPWGAYLWYETAAVWRLLALLLDPRWLSIDHDVLRLSPLWQQGAVAATAITACVAGWAVRRHPVLAWTLLWPALALAPHFLFRTNEWISEHQLYPSMVAVSVGLGAGAVWSAPHLDRAWRTARQAVRSALRVPMTLDASRSA